MPRDRRAQLVAAGDHVEDAGRERLPQRRPDGERVLTDLRHVGQSLHQVAVEERLGLVALLTWLRGQMADDKLEVAADRTRRLDSDAAAVQLVTIAPETRATQPNPFKPKPEAKPEPPVAAPAPKPEPKPEPPPPAAEPPSAAAPPPPPAPKPEASVPPAPSPPPPPPKPVEARAPSPPPPPPEPKPKPQQHAQAAPRPKR